MNGKYWMQLALLICPLSLAAAEPVVIARTCTTCHAPANLIPAIKSLKAAELSNLLVTLRDGENTVMHRLLASLNDAELRQVARILEPGR